MARSNWFGSYSSAISCALAELRAKGFLFDSNDVCEAVSFIRRPSNGSTNRLCIPCENSKKFLHIQVYRDDNHAPNNNYELNYYMA